MKVTTHPRAITIFVLARVQLLAPQFFLLLLQVAGVLVGILLRQVDIVDDEHSHHGLLRLPLRLTVPLRELIVGADVLLCQIVLVTVCFHLRVFHRERRLESIDPILGHAL